MRVSYFSPGKFLFPFMNENLGDFFDRDYRKQSSSNVLTDIYQKDDEIQIIAEVPGVSKENLNLSVMNDELIIEGKQNEVENQNELKYLRNERFKNNYYRSIRLNENCDFDGVKAKLNDGLLTISIPYKKAKPSKEVKIN